MATAQAAVVPDTSLTPAPRPAYPRRRNRRPNGPGESSRVRDMLSYLAVTLPDTTSPTARLLALQCALRVDGTLHVRLPKGMLRSLRLDTPEPWRHLEKARWLRTSPASSSGEIVARLFDATLLGQAPARPDRRRAADWALRASSCSAARATGPLPRLAGVYLAAHTDPKSDAGLGDLDQMARACGTPATELPRALDQLVTTGLLGSWQACPDSGDLQWTLASGTGVPVGDSETGNGPRGPARGGRWG